MFALRSLVKSNAQLAMNVIPKRTNVIATPARDKITRGEVVFLSTLMIIGWSAIPAWVLVNIKHYRDKN